MKRECMNDIAILAWKVFPGSSIHFPLFDKHARNEIVNILDRLKSEGVLSAERGSYVVCSHDNILDEPVELVNVDGEKLYFSRGEYSGRFLNSLRAVYPKYAFGLRLTHPSS